MYQRRHPNRHTYLSPGSHPCQIGPVHFSLDKENLFELAVIMLLQYNIYSSSEMINDDRYLDTIGLVPIRFSLSVRGE